MLRSKLSHRSLSVIDVMRSRTLDASFEELALKGLEKWRRISHNVSIGVLVKTLKRMKKLETAEKIEKEVLLVE